MDSGILGPATSGQDDILATGTNPGSGSGMVAPWIPHAAFPCAEAGLSGAAERHSEGRWVSTSLSVAAPLRECASAQDAQQVSSDFDAVEQTEVPTAFSSEEVSEIRVGSDFLQTLD